MARLIAGLIVLLCANAAAAQSWTGRTYDDGSYLHGSAVLSQGAMTFWCNAPSPQGLDPQMSDANLVEPMVPYAVRLMLGPSLAQPPGGAAMTVVLWIDGAGYAIALNVFGEEENLWASDINMDQPVILSLLTAQNVTAEIRGGSHWQIPLEGLAAQLRTALSYCISGWQGQGHPLPAALASLAGVAPAPIPPVAAANHPQFILQGSVVTRYWEILQAEVNNACGGAGSFSNDAWRNNNLDGEGSEDHVFDWNEVSCANGARPNCTASACMVTIQASSQAQAAPLEVIGQGPRFVPGQNGRSDLAFDRLITGCATPNQPLSCGPATLYWDGQGLQLR